MAIKINTRLIRFSKMIKKPILIILILFFLLFISQTEIYSWGFYAHKRINRMAVLTLPSDMIGFYKKHIEYITEHAVDPDKRRYAVQGEAERHYIDIDHYETDSISPFKIVPRKWEEAVAKFTEDTLRAYGIVPWHISLMVYQLSKAFKEENFDKILRFSADLGHYVGDAHVPLHTTENYNGQLTNQKGIHGFWESRIPEMKAEEYDYFVGRAKYIENSLDKAWQIVEDSHLAVDSVLLFEKELSNRFPTDNKYSYETRGAATVKTYSQDYTNAYDKMLNGMVERRMREAIITVGSLWYTAWVNAGKPDLAKYDDKELSDLEKEEEKKLEDEFQKGKAKGKICD